MKYSYLVAVVILSTMPCRADVPSSLFRDAFACSDRGPSSVCVFGTIPRGKPVTLLAKGWKSSAVPKEEFPNSDFNYGAKTITRLQVTTPPPKDADMIAVLAAAKSVNELPLEEVQDEALVGRIGQYIKTANELNLAADIRVLKTRLLRPSPTVLLSETFLASAKDAAALEKQLPTGCGECETVPILVGQNLEDLFKDIRSTAANSVERTCGGIKFAYAVSGRTYVLSRAFVCESDSFAATLVHDLSEAKPKLVFQLSGGS
jgi:hypothetical protein